MKLALLLLALTGIAIVSGTSTSSSTTSCTRPDTETTTTTTSRRTICGNNGVIYVDRTAYECAKRNNSRLRRISCSDSLILAKKALGNIRQQNQDGTLNVDGDRVRRLRERFEERQRANEYA